jgi:hypothetical protein
MKQKLINEAQTIIKKIDCAIKDLSNPKEFIDCMNHGFIKTKRNNIIIEDYMKRNGDYLNLTVIASELMQKWDEKEQCRPLAKWAFELESQNSGKEIITLDDFLKSRITTKLELTQEPGLPPRSTTTYREL